jgi:hypothetical protein
MGWLVPPLMITPAMFVICVIVVPLLIRRANNWQKTIITSLVVGHFRERHQTAQDLSIRRLPPLRRFFQADKRVVWVFVSVDRSSPRWVTVRHAMFATPVVGES